MKMGRPTSKINLFDSETTMSGKCADIAFVICDKKGNVINHMAVLVKGVYDDRENDPLFHNEDSDPLWSVKTLDKRYQAYDDMLNNGSRMLASVQAINTWLMQANAHYKPILTAYNIAFDLDKCRNTGINVDMFEHKFCLMHACKDHFSQSKKYRQFILGNHLFKNPTKLGNMSYSTTAETMTRFLLGIDIPNEPHQSLEDCMGYELPLLKELLKRKSLKWCLNDVNPLGWQNLQVKDWYKPK
jgi:hypothetical protein